MFILLVIGTVFLAYRSFTSSDMGKAMKAAMQHPAFFLEAEMRAKTNSAVIEALSTPIEHSGSYEWTLNSESSNQSNVTGGTIQFQLVGTKASGMVSGEVTKVGTNWEFKTLILKVDGSVQQIDLLKEK